MVKPLFRGWMHRAAAVAAIPAGVAVVMRSSGVEARVAAAVYAVSLLTLFLASSSYHRFRGSARWRFFLRRLDHSSIYLLIAGSYTPICLVALPSSYGVPLLAVLWAAGITGMAMKLGWFERSTKLGFALYLVMGWTAVLTVPGLVGELDGSTLALLGIGGVIYTLGAIVLATGWPKLAPRTFGFHELWHLMVVVAAGLHYVALSTVVAGA